MPGHAHDELTRSDFAAFGEEAFMPDSRTDTAAVFAFEEVTIGRVAWQFGARFERTKIAPDGAARRRDDELAGSIGTVWKINSANAMAVSLTIWHLHEGAKWNLDLRLAADVTRGRESGRNLPRIPAARTTAGISWVAGKWSAGAECQMVFRQSRIAPNESLAATMITTRLKTAKLSGAEDVEPIEKALESGGIVLGCM